MSRTFDLVDNIDINKFGKLDNCDADEVVKQRLGDCDVEAVGFDSSLVMAVRQMNGLVAAIDLAFINDLPLTLSPDDLWMAIV